ncbi:MAG: IGHMBP2 family helicase [Candidatus Krumholzibacteriota bacterium]|nr:IGHMBP2 family helicase [Candidatus Krumholzibacteriota bacterium]
MKGIKSERYFEKFKFIVEKEREEEMRRHESEIRNLSGREREEKGRALLNLRGKNHRTGLGGKYLIKFVRQRQGEMLPPHEINIGDLALLSRGNPLSKNNLSATVIEKSKYSITAVFDNPPPNYLYKKGLRMDLYVNDITFQRMIEALDTLAGGRGKLSEIRSKLIGETELSPLKKKKIKPFNRELNRAQIEASEKALSCADFFLIHGPPGTGKTVTCIEVIRQAVIAGGETVLAAAGSNVAVDNILERLIEHEVNAVRIGHPARVNPVLRKHSLDLILEEDPLYRKSVILREKAMSLKDKQNKYTHPGGRWRRGMSNTKIRQLADRGARNRGVPAGKIKDMAKWLDIQDDIDNLFTEIDKLEQKAVSGILNGADVVCATNSTAGSDVLSGRHFDLLVLDEATQSTEPEALIPLVKADRAVLAGDHKQLPPTILSEDARRQGLGKSLFERLLEIHGDRIREMLKVQYRMNQDIMGFSSNEFYSGKLTAHQSVKKWTLRDLGATAPRSEFQRFVFDPGRPVVFIDTTGKESREETSKDSKSFFNRFEAKLAVDIIKTAADTGIDHYDIGLIAPYKAQTEFIRSLISDERTEINTVDGFQGREKEVIILSLVRTNKDGNIGFLKDLRRLNVSLTRAKKKLIVIGHSPTLSTHESYRRLIDYIKGKNGYYPAE